MPEVTLYKPAGVPARGLERVSLSIDELEAMRLVDAEGLTQEQAAAAMQVSRQTVGRIVESARAKVSSALVAGRAIQIGGGPVRFAGCPRGRAGGHQGMPPGQCRGPARRGRAQQKETT
jgi:predicted DNA-binding protein (UPF0251 family)